MKLIFPMVANPSVIAKQGFAVWPKDYIPMKTAVRVKKDGSWKMKGK